MYRANNKKVKLQDDGPSYELFLIPENAQHIIDRASHHSHKVTLTEVMKLAASAYYVPNKTYMTPEPHLRVMGLVKYNKKYYQVVAYLTDTPSRRCILESCHVLNDDKLLRWCQNNADLIKTAPN